MASVGSETLDGTRPPDLGNYLVARGKQYQERGKMKTAIQSIQKSRFNISNSVVKTTLDSSIWQTKADRATSSPRTRRRSHV